MMQLVVKDTRLPMIFSFINKNFPAAAVEGGTDQSFAALRRFPGRSGRHQRWPVEGLDIVEVDCEFGHRVCSQLLFGGFTAVLIRTGRVQRERTNFMSRCGD